MKVNLISSLTLFLCCAGVAGAQSALVPYGAEGSGAGGSVSVTVGQVAARSVQDAAHYYGEGVQQAYGVVEQDGIDGVMLLPYEVNVYPNPTTDRINVSATGSDGTLRYVLYAPNGAILQEGTMSDGKATILLAKYPVGGYPLCIVDGQGRQCNFKVIKAK